MSVQPKNVLEALDTCYTKFRGWVSSALAELEVNELTADALKLNMDHDVVVVLPYIRKFLTQHQEALQNKDVTYFQILAPEEFQDMEIPDEISNKAFLYARVFASLIVDLEEE